MNSKPIPAPHLFVLVLSLAFVSQSRSQDAPAPAPAPDLADDPPDLPSFQVRIVPAYVKRTDFPPKPDANAAAKPSTTATKPNRADPADRTGEPEKPQTTTEKKRALPEPIPIREALNGDNRPAAFEAPTALLFLSGFHLDIIPSPPQVGNAPEADTASSAQNADDSSIRGRVQIVLPPPPAKDANVIEASAGEPSISIFDRNGNTHDYDGKLNTVIETRILKDVLGTLPVPLDPQLRAGAVRNILDLVVPVTGHQLIEQNAGRLARALDQAILVKKADGARGAVVYVHGEMNQSFFDDLNVSGLDIPITTYVGVDGFRDTPEGYSKLSEYPATVMMWKGGQLLEPDHLSQDDLRELKTNGLAKQILVKYLGLFDKSGRSEKAKRTPRESTEGR